MLSTNNNNLLFFKIWLKSLVTILSVCVITLSSCTECKKVPVNPFGIENMIKKLAVIGFYIDPKIINLTDSDYQKFGLWLYENDDYIFMTTYNNGEKDGVELIFNSKANPIRLHYLIIYKDSFMTDVISFDNGLINGTTQNIRINDEYPEFDKVFPYVGYDRYYKNGKIEAEGNIILGEEWEIDCENIGEWKIYDDNGNYTTKYRWPERYDL